jgi:NhaP-type Na+/H+ or K+/H+ antiporter
VDHRLGVLLEGESLFNDGVALVLPAGWLLLLRVTTAKIC